VDIETRRKKQKALIHRMVERKVRSRAQELHESRGQAEGNDLQDWFQAEAEVIENTSIATLYRRLPSKGAEQGSECSEVAEEEAVSSEARSRS
jgi:hypothetical protein